MTKDFDQGFYSVPDDKAIGKMSFVEATIARQRAPQGSAQYDAYTRRIMNIYAEDAVKINRSNVVLGAVIAGVFALGGVLLGWCLRSP